MGFYKNTLSGRASLEETKMKLKNYIIDNSVVSGVRSWIYTSDEDYMNTKIIIHNDFSIEMPCNINIIDSKNFTKTTFMRAHIYTINGSVFDLINQ